MSLSTQGALEMLAAAMSERSKRLQAMVAKSARRSAQARPASPGSASTSATCAGYSSPIRSPLFRPGELLTELAQQADTGSPYITAVRQLSAQNVATATAWLAK